ncbi:uncharacterized protein PG986_013608 [Apiospora aurea]|uniref:Uncharacterized protein n=1 Tax=Apiospora aurea TaxID=335848 RepID=A0ABR1PW16_9PEZI
MVLTSSRLASAWAVAALTLDCQAVQFELPGPGLSRCRQALGDWHFKLTRMRRSSEGNKHDHVAVDKAQSNVFLRLLARLVDPPSPPASVPAMSSSSACPYAHWVAASPGSAQFRNHGPGTAIPGDARSAVPITDMRIHSLGYSIWKQDGGHIEAQLSPNFGGVVRVPTRQASLPP